MVFRRRMSNLRPIHAIKHIVDIQGAVAVATKTSDTIIAALDAPVLANVAEVETGSRVSSIYLNIQATHETLTALANIYMIIYKIPGGNIASGAVPNANVTGANDFKRQIFHTEMKMGPGDVTTKTPITIFNGVLKIPKVFHSFRVNDRVDIELFAPGTTWNYCIQAIYKEYR